MVLALFASALEDVVVDADGGDRARLVLLRVWKSRKESSLISAEDLQDLRFSHNDSCHPLTLNA